MAFGRSWPRLRAMQTANQVGTKKCQSWNKQTALSKIPWAQSWVRQVQQNVCSQLHLQAALDSRGDQRQDLEKDRSEASGAE
jgi:hypothetical protein